MTTPPGGTRPSSPPSRQLSDDAVASVQQALAAEHAAVWVYGLVSAFLPQAYTHAVRRDRTAHRSLRDQAAHTLLDAGATPHPAAAAYRTPKPVTDEMSAAAAVAAAESDAANAWHAVLVRTDAGSSRVRGLASDALNGAATRGTAWRDAAGVSPVVVALPGMNPKR